jgi:phenylpropionate dioxygenase-like ring-hydroxylating dioxygenase large terminal subunit
MLVTKQPVFQRFWYPVIPLSELDEGPRGFTLLGQPIALWKDADGKPAAVIDRCCHRTARLSLGWVHEGNITCPYHGWQFDCGGQCQSVPQIGDRVPNKQLRVRSYPCEERYGYVWVCLSDDPLNKIPEFEEASTNGFRQIFEFYEVWDCAGLRLMENSFDAAHVAFVHRNSFGDINDPIPNVGELTYTEDGFYLTNTNRVDNSKVDQSVTRSDTAATERHTITTYYPPFIRKSQINYPNGLVHSIITCATPINDRSSQICQWVYRNDTEEDTPSEKVVAFDRRITFEDKEILESCDFDVPVDQKRRAELHMASDRPGMAIRRIIMKLIEDNGEKESTLSDYETYDTDEVIAFKKDMAEDGKVPASKQ